MQRMAREAGRKTLPRRFSGRSMTIAFIDEQNARELNKKYRNRDYATDVLSFAGDGDELGELAICLRTASKQAKANGVLVREEIGYLVLHGFLHLLGYEHENNKAQEKKMFRLQDALWETLRA